jgi:hypothetical protein
MHVLCPIANYSDGPLLRGKEMNIKDALDNLTTKARCTTTCHAAVFDNVSCYTCHTCHVPYFMSMSCTAWHICLYADP